MNKSLQICVKSLSNIISKEDKISYKKANDVVNEVFDNIIINTIKKGEQSTGTSFENIKKTFRKFFPLKNFFRKLQSVIYPEDFELSHLRILRKNSKFYNDFKPIYKIISNKNFL